MITPLSLPASIEPEVRFIEEADPAQIVDATIRKLRDGASPNKLLAASALAVSRSTELPNDHHGGPVHPVSGIHAVAGTAAHLDGDWTLMPVVQSVALANKHIHSPDMGPAIMPALACAGDDDRNAIASAFTTAVRNGHPRSAERHLQTLVTTHSPGEVLDLLLSTSIRRNGLDDHYFLYPIHALRALDDIGWEWAGVVLRPVVRYLSTNMRTVGIPGDPVDLDYSADNLRHYHSFHVYEELIERYELLEREIVTESSPHEDEAVGALGERIGECTKFAEIPEMLAAALADDLSLAGAGEALSIGATMIHLRTDYGNPFDVHLHTGVNTRRYVLGLDGVDPRHKLLALLSWAGGPEVRLCEERIAWPVRADVASDAHREQDALLDAVTASITGRTPIDIDAVGYHIEEIDAGPEVRVTMALAQEYADKGYDAQAFFQRMGELICRDDFTEMHAFKHLQAAIEEYHSTRGPWRWMQLPSTAKVAWCSYGLAQDVYGEARKHLAI